MTTATARHILVDTEAQCLELKEKIENGEDFADIARQFSSCPSKAQGGDLGQFGPGMMVKEFDEVVFNAEVNSLQGPVKTQFGFHLHFFIRVKHLGVWLGITRLELTMALIGDHFCSAGVMVNAHQYGRVGNPLR